MSMETRKVLLSPPASAQQPAILLGHAIGSHFDTFGFGVLLPPTSTTILDPDTETKRRSSEDPEVLRPLWAGLEVGMGGITGGG